MVCVGGKDGSKKHQRKGESEAANVSSSPILLSGLFIESRSDFGPAFKLALGILRGRSEFCGKRESVAGWAVLSALVGYSKPCNAAKVTLEPRSRFRKEQRLVDPRESADNFCQKITRLVCSEVSRMNQHRSDSAGSIRSCHRSLARAEECGADKGMAANSWSR